MAKNIPYWQWLAKASDEFRLDRAGFLQLFRKGEEEPCGAFLFPVGGDWIARARDMVREKGPLDSFDAKLIVDTDSLAREGRSVGERELGFALRKTVVRAWPFRLRYEGATGKVMVASGEGERAPAPSSAAVPEKVSAAPAGKIKVLIVDDSPTIRKILEKIFALDPELEVVASVGLPSQVEAAIEKHRPHVVTLDIHMPEMNGVELLQRYMPKYRVPTVMISSISVEEGPLVLSALEAGAVDYIQKPGAQEIESVAPFILLKVKTAARASLQKAAPRSAARIAVESAQINLSRLVAIGSSTGGTEALKEVFLRLPKEIPPIVVVQHIPAVFSKAFADRMNQLCPFEVLEGRDGMVAQPGRVIIAPGGTQMRLKRVGAAYHVIVEDAPPVNRHKPSVDVLMNSVAELCGADAVGVILTGMGADGAKGLLAMKEAGAYTLGQDEKTCVVYGMPQAAFKLGATHKMVPLYEVADAIVAALLRKKRAA